MRRHGHGRRGRAIRPQEHGQVGPLPRVRAKRPPGPAAPGRLPVGNGAQTVRRAAHGLGLEITVRGVDLRKAPHRRPPRLRQVGQHVPGRERVRPRAQAVAPVRDRVDIIAVCAQRAHRLADRRARHAQLFAHFLAGEIPLRLREQEQNIVPQHEITLLWIFLWCQFSRWQRNCKAFFKTG